MKRNKSLNEALLELKVAREKVLDDITRPIMPYIRSSDQWLAKQTMLNEIVNKLHKPMLYLWAASFAALLLLNVVLVNWNN